jgi:hypothetical protein
VAKTLDNVALPIVIDQFTGVDAEGTQWILELYIDTPTGAVKARVVDPPPKTTAAP